MGDIITYVALTIMVLGIIAGFSVPAPRKPELSS